MPHCDLQCNLFRSLKVEPIRSGSGVDGDRSTSFVRRGRASKVNRAKLLTDNCSDPLRHNQNQVYSAQVVRSGLGGGSRPGHAAHVKKGTGVISLTFSKFKCFQED